MLNNRTMNDINKTLFICYCTCVNDIHSGLTILLWSKCIVVKEYFGTRTFSPFECNNNNEGEKKKKRLFVLSNDRSISCEVKNVRSVQWHTTKCFVYMLGIQWFFSISRAFLSPRDMCLFLCNSLFSLRLHINLYLLFFFTVFYYLSFVWLIRVAFFFFLLYSCCVFRCHYFGCYNL